jgi:uncharacterized repeat protein (TIGR03803 family)
MGHIRSIAIKAVSAILTLALIPVTVWAAPKEIVLHNFNDNGKDALAPYAGLIIDTAGNLYGATPYGGTYNVGTVFELSPQTGGNWTEKVLHSFGGRNDGASLYATPVLDAAGNLYGPTYYGGSGCNTYGCGTVYELTPQANGKWTERVLHDFNSNNGDGFWPFGGLIFDPAGNLYGTTVQGGAHRCIGGCGTVFELSKAGEKWTEEIVHDFHENGTGGLYPSDALIIDSAGNLYGAAGGGKGGGVVFELVPTTGGGWTEHVLHSFSQYGKTGDGPGHIIFDAAGNIYGTTRGGGTYGAGTVFELTPAVGGGWTEKVLHNFGNGNDGVHAYGGVIFDATGNLYGTTYNGGNSTACTNGCGIVYELVHGVDGSWSEKILHDFGSGHDGALPYSGLTIDGEGHLYGTTSSGGVYHEGTVFEIVP